MVPVIFLAVWGFAQSFQSDVSRPAYTVTPYLNLPKIKKSSLRSKISKFSTISPMTNENPEGACWTGPEIENSNPLVQINPYPVHSCEQRQKKKAAHFSLSTSYAKHFLSVVGVVGCDCFDEAAIIRLLRSSYLSSMWHVHLVLENLPDTSSCSSSVSKQLSAIIARFKARVLTTKQFNQVMDYACKIDFLKKIPSLDREYFEKVLLGITYKLVVEGTDSSNEHINLKNLKAWLAVALPVLGQTDLNLAALKARLGDYHASLQWQSELHLNSFAKHSARRIYRNLKTSTVIAETLDEDGRILETELIEQLTSGAFNFVTFDADGSYSPFGMIRNHRGQSAIRLAPDVCFGCHYDAKTGEFNVLRPSFIELNLKDCDFANEDLIKQRMSFLKPGERTVLHK